RNDFHAGAKVHVYHGVKTFRAKKAAGGRDLPEEGRKTDRGDLAAAARSAAVEQSAGRGASFDGRQPPRRRLAHPAAGIFRPLGEHPAADGAAAQYLGAGNAAATAVT